MPLLTACAAVLSIQALVTAPSPAQSAPPAKPPAAKPPVAKPPSAVPSPSSAVKPGAPANVARNIGGPGDFGLRERLVKKLMRDPDIATTQIKVVMVNGGVVLSGPMPTWAVRRRALVAASTERGIINVTDQMSVPRGDVKDAAILKGVTDLLKEQVTPLEIKNLQVTVEDSVVTLNGTVKDFASRVRAEEVAGTVLGATRFVNRLRPATATNGGPDDASIRKAVVDYLKNYREYAYLGEIGVQVKDGKATLTGVLPYFIGRQQAATMTALVGGVREVENRIDIDTGLVPEVMVVKEIP